MRNALWYVGRVLFFRPGAAIHHSLRGICVRATPPIMEAVTLEEAVDRAIKNNPTLAERRRDPARRGAAAAGARADDARL